jgi:hydrogenase maturation factor
LKSLITALVLIIMMSLLQGRGFGRSISLVEAIDDYSGSSHYDASLGNMMTTATGFVMEALDKKNMKQATSILTQMVIMHTHMQLHQI